MDNVAHWLVGDPVHVAREYSSAFVCSITENESLLFAIFRLPLDWLMNPVRDRNFLPPRLSLFWLKVG